MDARIAEALKGYARANEYLEDERMARLARMTPAESRAIFAELVATWSPAGDSGNGLEHLEQWRAETLISVRHALWMLAVAQGAV
jgi:hypothetical protein